MKKLVISIVLLNLLAACASTKLKEPEAAAPSAAPVTAPVAAPTTGSGSAVTSMPTTAPLVKVDALNDPASLLFKRSVYFPFDVSAVQDADKPIVQAHAKFLSENSDRKVRLEGNADERGSNEYNLALGQRRAESVMKMMILGGARVSQLDAVSYGEEKPKATGHDEESWAQNRRTDIKY